MEGEAFNPKSNVPAVKHRGGSIMLWDCFVAYGTGTLHEEDRKMKKLQILQLHLKTAR